MRSKVGPRALMVVLGFDYDNFFALLPIPCSQRLLPLLGVFLLGSKSIKYLLVNFASNREVISFIVFLVEDLPVLVVLWLLVMPS